MIEVATRTSNPRSRGERTKRRQRHLIMSKEKEKQRSVCVNIALSNEKNGNYILVSTVFSFPGGKDGRCVGLTFMCRLSRNSGTSTSGNPMGPSRPVAGKLYRYLFYCV